MRADRLITTLLLLQSRGRLTARDLATELEVSERTVMRDMEALGAAGVPVYSIRGAGGGYEIWDGFRSQLTGLTAEEAAAIGLIGAPRTAAALGLGEARQRVELKLRQALPPHLRDESTELQNWFHDDEEVPTEPELARVLVDVRVAITRGRVITARTSLRSANSKALHPLGLVRKSGAWHLVALVMGRPEAFPLASLSDVRATGRTFERPASFDLAEFWQNRSTTGLI